VVSFSSEIYATKIGFNSTSANGLKRISQMGPDNDPLYRYNAKDPELAYNPDRGETMIIWLGDDDRSFTGDGDFAVYSQRINTQLQEVGEDDKRIEFLIGPSNDVTNRGYVAGAPSIAYHPDRHEYVVVYGGTDHVDGSDITGIFATRLSGRGQVLSPYTSYLVYEGDARYPNIAAGGDGAGYLIIWQDRDARKIEGIHLRAADAQPESGIVSITSSSEILSSFLPEVDYDPSTSNYVVTWTGNQVTSWEILLAEVASGALMASGPTQVSRADSRFSSGGSTAVGNGGKLLTTWHGQDDRLTTGHNSNGIFGQVTSTKPTVTATRITEIQVQGPDAHILWIAGPEIGVRIQTSPDLKTWSDSSPEMTGNGTVQTWIATGAIQQSTQNYYRLIAKDPR
jgi:hypothetical protein